MARKKANPRPEPEMYTIYADILQETDEAILIDCAGAEVWLPVSQIRFEGERGDKGVEIVLPDWLADDKGLADGQGGGQGVSPETGHAGPLCPDTTAADQPFRFHADVLAVGKEEVTLQVVNVSGGTWKFNARKEDLRWDGDDLTDLQAGYKGIRFLVTWEMAEVCGLVHVLGASLPVHAEADAEGEEEAATTLEDEAESEARPYRHCLRTETVQATITLTSEEREACARRITEALAERTSFKDLAASYSAKAREAEKEAYKASAIFERGEEERNVTCNVIGDYNRGLLIYVECEAPYREIMRRPMTDRDLQLRLPFEQPEFPSEAPADARPGWTEYTMELDGLSEDGVTVFVSNVDLSAPGNPHGEFAVPKDSAIIYSDLQALEPGDEIRFAVPEVLARELGLLAPEVTEDLEAPDGTEFVDEEALDASEAEETEAADPTELEPVTV